MRIIAMRIKKMGGLARLGSHRPSCTVHIADLPGRSLLLVFFNRFTSLISRLLTLWNPSSLLSLDGSTLNPHPKPKIGAPESDRDYSPLVIEGYEVSLDSRSPY